MSVKIYRISHSSEACQIFAVPDPDAFARDVMMDITHLDEDYKMPEFQKATFLRKSDGFYNIFDRFLSFNEDIYFGELGSLLGYSGSIYKTKLTEDQSDLYILNVTVFYNCLNVSKTTFIKGRQEEVGVDHGRGIRKFEFYHKLIGDSRIFRIPQMPYAVFVATDGSGEDFYSVYQKMNLTSLSFEEVWSAPQE